MAVMTEAQLQELYKTGTKYRKEILVAPLIFLESSLQHMTLRTGIAGKEIVGSADDDTEMMPYRSAKDAVEGLPPIDQRTLETYLGSVVREFDANLLLGTIYGNSLSTDVTATDIAKLMVMMMVQKVSSKLNQELFTAVRNASGTKTRDLFDGFVTILNKEITAGTLTQAKRNLVDLDLVTKDNVVDKLKSAYLDGTTDELQGQATKLFIPRGIYNMYCDCYKKESGSVAYNTQYKKTYLEGTDDMCELTPMLGLRNTDRMILTTKNNMLVGCSQESDKENVLVRMPDNPKATQFYMAMFFGTQFESIHQNTFSAFKFKTTAEQA